MSATTAYLVRHGTPDWGRRDLRYDIPPGPSLVEKGREEARLAGAFLRGAGVAALLASPMDRAAQTAAEIAELLRLPPEPDARLTEWARGEQAADVTARVLAFWGERVTPATAPIALVSHGGPIRMLLAHVAPDLDLRPYTARFDHGNCMPPAGIWRVERPAPEAPWRVTLCFTPEMVARVV